MAQKSSGKIVTVGSIHGVLSGDKRSTHTDDARNQSAPASAAFDPAGSLSSDKRFGCDCSV